MGFVVTRIRTNSEAQKHRGHLSATHIYQLSLFYDRAEKLTHYIASSIWDLQRGGYLIASN